MRHITASSRPYSTVSWSPTSISNSSQFSLGSGHQAPTSSLLLFFVLLPNLTRVPLALLLDLYLVQLGVLDCGLPLIFDTLSLPALSLISRKEIEVVPSVLSSINLRQEVKINRIMKIVSPPAIGVKQEDKLTNRKLRARSVRPQFLLHNLGVSSQKWSHHRPPPTPSVSSSPSLTNALLNFQQIAFTSQNYSDPIPE